ncbi:MAG: hypothetical protein JJ693_06930 [Acidithiobacillus sp.]|nr:hypothetical protein [Acidithiobacillus sp.]
MGRGIQQGHQGEVPGTHRHLSVVALRQVQQGVDLGTRRDLLWGEVLGTHRDQPEMVFQDHWGAEQ